MHLLPRVGILLSIAGVAALALAGCAPAGPSDAERAATISVEDIDSLGEVLVDGEGSVLYVFEPDNAMTVSCISSCAKNWPPLFVPAPASETEATVPASGPSAGPGVDPALFGELPSPEGGHVISYNGWALYRYAADRTPGEHRGQNKDLNGGAWYAMRPDGTPLMP